MLIIFLSFNYNHSCYKLSTIYIYFFIVEIINNNIELLYLKTKGLLIN